MHIENLNKRTSICQSVPAHSVKIVSQQYEMYFILIHPEVLHLIGYPLAKGGVTKQLSFCKLRSITCK